MFSITFKIRFDKIKLRQFLKSSKLGQRLLSSTLYCLLDDSLSFCMQRKFGHVLLQAFKLYEFEKGYIYLILINQLSKGSNSCLHVSSDRVELQV
jgi:hypothetical protein